MVEYAKALEEELSSTETLDEAKAIAA